MAVIFTSLLVLFSLTITRTHLVNTHQTWMKDKECDVLHDYTIEDEVFQKNGTVEMVFMNLFNSSEGLNDSQAPPQFTFMDITSKSYTLGMETVLMRLAPVSILI